MLNDLSMSEAMSLVKAAEGMPRAERLKLQRERLIALVHYARAHSPYYRRLYADLPVDFAFRDLPSTDKQSLIKRYEDWVTDDAITLEGVKAYLERPDGRLYLDKYTALTTSGTTGAPMPMVRDQCHNAIHGAMLSSRFLRDKRDLLDPSKHRIAAVIFTDPRVSSYGSFLRARAARPEYADNMLAVSPALGTREIVRILNDFQPDIVTCYPSAMCALALERQKGNLRISLKAIACSAEALTDDMYALFTRTFGCPVLNNYCSTEGGEIAMASGCPHLHVNEDWVIVEPVDADRNAVRDVNEWSSGVLVTDLSNFVQPVIRYYVNDRIKLHDPCDGGCVCGSHFPYMEIQGRSGGVAQVCGRNVIIANLTFALHDIRGAYIIQIAQTAPDTLEIRALTAPEADREAVYAEAEGILRALLEREGCEGYRVVRSDAQPMPNERGGKLQTYIKLY